MQLVPCCHSLTIATSPLSFSCVKDPFEVKNDSHFCAVGGRNRGGRGRPDSLVGTTVKIHKGPYKGYRGRVKDVHGTSVRVELDSIMKVVSGKYLRFILSLYCQCRVIISVNVQSTVIRYLILQLLQHHTGINLFLHFLCCDTLLPHDIYWISVTDIFLLISDSHRYGLGSETPMHPSRTPMHPTMTPMHPTMTPMRDPGGRCYEISPL